MRVPFRFVMPALLALAACGSDGKGTVRVTAYGESFIEEGIPAEEVVDGWAVTFSRFEVAVRDVVVAGARVSVPDAIELTTPSSGEGHELGTVLVPAGEYREAGFTVARVEVEGMAEKGDEAKAFSWVLDAPTHYAECDTTTVVPDGGTATFQITVHADHLFYDSLVAEEPELRFQTLADADTDEDGEITEAELAVTDIGAYDPGSEGGIDTLWEWLVAQSRTLGHVDGEGHCRTSAED
ncbi:MAG: hypothetical protein DIU78_008020 [Pseudomonadota bacterium]|nr:MAG: hypothetical protein DIU78_01950 [Pseudomonadota bacterium]